ncbi:molybdopterin dinucleotide binding domain-containing protein [Cytobacillus dafuensis]|uniref:molybdopterin dinucleotide binding domain-containing protein n=1 Tax=Cytobacillus dafuensis TaxID=1742359 RepID=UPI00070CE9E3|nr:molybdopterin dinucleotide binding domain-containing protein [Cytobacillus dafuensis]
MNHAEYILYVGAFPGHSGKPTQTIARRAVGATTDGVLKFTVVDPVMCGGAVGPIGDKAKWVPIKPTTDGAFVMALIQWIFENKKYNEEFLSAPSLDKARLLGYNSWTNGCQLVITDPEHPNYRKMLRPADLGMPASDEEEIFIVIDKKTGQPALHTAVDEAEILYNGKIKTIDGQTITVRTSLDFLKESAYAHDMETYSKECGIPVQTIEEIAKKFTSHGVKVGAEGGFGGTSASNGVQLAFAMQILPALIGSYNKKGGMMDRRKMFASFVDGPRYNMKTIEGATKTSGVVISRTGVRYEDTTEYKNIVARGENPYPSKFPWHPVGSASDNQAIFSIINQYPYQAKIVMNWMFNPLLSTPSAARKEVIEKLCDVNIVPLFISSDAFMGEMTAIADYVIPDTTQFENWGIGFSEGTIPVKLSKVRWPVVEPMTTKISDNRYACIENYLIDVCKKVGIPGFGDKAFSDKDGNVYAVNNPEDFFLPVIANVAFDEEPVPDISDHEIELQGLKSKMEKWKSSLKQEELRKVAYVISRGGRFENLENGYVGEDKSNFKYPFEGCFKIYAEEAGSAKDSYTGEYYSGVPGWYPETFADGTLLTEKYSETEWPFRGANYKPKFRSVTMLANTRLRDLSKTNYLEINTDDAKKLGLKTGDKVKLIAATGGEVTGELLVRQGVSKGTVAVEFGYGHWEYGAKKHKLGDKTIGGVKDIGDGVNLTEISLMDPTFEYPFALSEMMTGSVSRNGGLYRIEKA